MKNHACLEHLFKKTALVSLSQLKIELIRQGFVKSFQIIHIVGTNGKGSVAEIINHNLLSQGFKVGLFTSPHLISPYERIKVNNKAIDPWIFWEIYNKLELKNNFFATFYLVAMLYFQTSKCDIVILEAGIGGKLDPTATYKGEYGILTSLGLEHTEILGNTIEAIAKQKYGIKNLDMKFYLPNNLIHLYRLFWQLNNIWVDNKANHYQTQNFKLAQAFLTSEFDIATVQDVLPLGRSEVLTYNNVVIGLDVAHNIVGINSSLTYFKSKKIRFKTIVVMLKKTKDINSLKALFRKYQVYYYQTDDSFHDFKTLGWNKVQDLTKFFNTQTCSTLYIGSFKLISAIYRLLQHEVRFNERILND